MNVGDRLYCIKDFTDASDTIFYYKKGKTYTISEKFKRVVSDIEYEYYVYTIPNNESVTTTLSEIRISKHFITVNEYRKQKLKKLKIYGR